MPTHTRRETVVRRIDHILPVPAVGAELRKVLSAAERDYRNHIPGFGGDEPLSDDALNITVADTEIVISFTIEEPAR